MTPLLTRVLARTAPTVTIMVDGVATEAFAGESVLVAILSQKSRLRAHEVDGSPRAGFCLMGACQDCWVWLPDGDRVRACTTRVSDGVSVMTCPPVGCDG